MKIKLLNFIKTFIPHCSTEQRSHEKTSHPRVGLEGIHNKEWNNLKVNGKYERII